MNYCVVLNDDGLFVPQKKCFFFLFYAVTHLPVKGGLKNVVNGSAKYMIAISSIVSPILCIWIVKYGKSDDVAENTENT